MENVPNIALMLPVREVARILHIHSNTVRRWSDQGILKAYRVNHRGDRRFRHEDIIYFRDALQEQRGNGKEVKVDWG